MWNLERTRINPDVPLKEYYGGGRTQGFFEEDRFKDIQMVYEVSAENFRIEDRWQDREYVAWDMNINCDIEAPGAGNQDIPQLAIHLPADGRPADGNQ